MAGRRLVVFLRLRAHSRQAPCPLACVLWPLHAQHLTRPAPVLSCLVMSCAVLVSAAVHSGACCWRPLLQPCPGHAAAGDCAHTTHQQAGGCVCVCVAGDNCLLGRGERGQGCSVCVRGVCMRVHAPAGQHVPPCVVVLVSIYSPQLIMRCVLCLAPAHPPPTHTSELFTQTHCVVPHTGLCRAVLCLPRCCSTRCSCPVTSRRRRWWLATVPGLLSTGCSSPTPWPPAC